jgi:hypothetical protein
MGTVRCSGGGRCGDSVCPAGEPRPLTTAGRRAKGSGARCRAIRQPAQRCANRDGAVGCIARCNGTVRTHSRREHLQAAAWGYRERAVATGQVGDHSHGAQSSPCVAIFGSSCVRGEGHESPQLRQLYSAPPRGGSEVVLEVACRCSWMLHLGRGVVGPRLRYLRGILLSVISLRPKAPVAGARCLGGESRPGTRLRCPRGPCVWNSKSSQPARTSRAHGCNTLCRILLSVVSSAPRPL